MPLLIRIDPEDDRAIYVQIMDEIRRAVLLGGLTAGEALPSVREVAAEVGVSPESIRRWTAMAREAKARTIVPVRVRQEAAHDDLDGASTILDKFRT